MIFWLLMGGSAGIVSLLTWNPLPLGVMILVYLLTRPIENPLREQVVAGGLNPETPPMPTSGIGCAGCLVWCLVMAGAALLFIGLAGALLTEGVGGL